MAARLPPASPSLACPLGWFQQPAGGIKEEIWRAWADVTAELTSACVGQHAAQIERNALHR